MVDRAREPVFGVTRLVLEGGLKVLLGVVILSVIELLAVNSNVGRSLLIKQNNQFQNLT